MSYGKHFNNNNKSEQTASTGPQGRKRKRTSQDSTSQEDIAWTAARCNRLLRTVSSRISTLRRLIKTERDSSFRQSEVVNKDARKRSTEHWSTTDPVWLPTGSRKPVQKTYTNRDKPANAPRGRRLRRDASLVLPSPFVKRIASSGHPGAAIATEGSEVPSSPVASKSRRSRQLPVKSNSAIQEAEKGLEASLAQLLSTTRDAVASERIGAASLLQTCLRSVPAYLDLYDGADRDEDEPDDSTSEVLTYLEGFGTRQGGGWERLRDVVRSQGVHLICHAVRDQLVCDDVVHVLIDICSAQRAVHEGQRIIQAWLLSAGNSSPERIAKLDSFTTLHGCEAFKYRTLSIITDTDLANCTKQLSLQHFDNELLASISGPAGYAATKYFCRWIACVLQQEQAGHLPERSRAIFKTGIMKLCVMSIASSLLRNPGIDSHNLRDAMQDAIAQVAFGLPRHSKEKAQKLLALSSTLIFCSQLLALLNCQCCPNRRIRQRDAALWDQLADRLVSTHGDARDAGLRDLHEDFAINLAQGIVALEERIDLGLPELLLEAGVEAIARGPLTTSLLRHIGLEMITARRQAGCVVEDDICKKYLHQMTVSSERAMPAKTPSRTPCQAPFRWEEGLCEWIAATPLAMNKSLSDEDSLGGPDASTGLEYLKPQLRPTQCSPDVLAVTPKFRCLKRKSRRSLLEAIEQRTGVVVIHRGERWKRRKSNRVSAKERAQESADELGF